MWSDELKNKTTISAYYTLKDVSSQTLEIVVSGKDHDDVHYLMHEDVYDFDSATSVELTDLRLTSEQQVEINAILVSLKGLYY